MKTFLEIIAQDILNKYGTDLSRIAVVFPNKRASLFLNNALARLAGKPIWSPAYITISDLFRRHSDLQAADDIKLICDLHKVFVSCTQSSETLDKFYGWGQLLLTDFDDIDKNMADADKVFANLKDIHELDDVSYLSDEQKEILKKFFSNFSEEHNSELKQKFLSLWSHFGDIYHQYNQMLAEQGYAYEGALYRKVVTDESIQFEYDTYLFVGFNMMQKVELQLLDRLKKEQRARFYWDFDDYYMKSRGNEAGTYIRQYLEYYPNELDRTDGSIYNNFRNPKDITFVSAPTENIQARYISDWLHANHRIEAGSRTAIVMSDESLLQTVIHCLPPEVTKVNITTGYPLSQSPFAALVTQLIALQTIGHPLGSDIYRLHYVNLVLRHPYIQYLSEKSHDLIDDLNQHKRFYPSRKSLSLDEGLALLFSSVDEATVKDADTTYDQNLELCNWLLLILKRIGVSSRDKNDDPLFGESLFRMYTLINRLQGLISSGDLKINITTFERLVNQLIQTTSIPFHGEPAVGLQVMGVLETRNLDFDHVLLLSCNEGNLPKGVNDASFIPYSIRKAHNLTTIDNKVAIYAYYFHSLLQRAGDITITYNNATEEGKTGEMSRFMLQLMVEGHQDIHQISLKAGQEPIQRTVKAIGKDDSVQKKLSSIDRLSPTAINSYLRCQLRFYYRYIAGLQEPDETDEDEMDNRIFGNIFHKAAQDIYLSFARPADIRTTERNGRQEQELIRPIEITEEQIDSFLKDKSRLDRILDDAFSEELFKIEKGRQRPQYNGLQLINKTVIKGYLHQLLRLDRQVAPFTILGLEKKVSTTVSLADRQLSIYGYIDRLDSIRDTSGSEHIRVIDYKTGNSSVQNLKVGSIDDIFTGEQITKNHTDYYLQAILYSLIISNDPEANPGEDPVQPGLLFILHAGGKDFDPTLLIGKEKILNVNTYRTDFEQQLHDKLTEIFDPSLPFLPTIDKQRCSSCPYRQLCGE